MPASHGLTVAEKLAKYKLYINAMIIQEKQAAGLDPNDPTAQALSVTALSHHDNIIRSAE